MECIKKGELTVRLGTDILPESLTRDSNNYLTVRVDPVISMVFLDRPVEAGPLITDPLMVKLDPCAAQLKLFDVFTKFTVAPAWGQALEKAAKLDTWSPGAVLTTITPASEMKSFTAKS